MLAAGIKDTDSFMLTYHTRHRMASELHPESMMFMVERVTEPPFRDGLKDMLRVENDMKNW